MIELNNMAFYAYHGVLPQERTVGGHFTISLRLSADIREACRTDDLTDTIDYAAVCAIVKSEMEQPSNLIEHVAARIGHSLLDAFPTLNSVEVRLCKLHPPVPDMEIAEACYTDTFVRPTSPPPFSLDPLMGIY